jgi:predicted AlkP superfamily phosphohydrolase/phosphomutase
MESERIRKKIIQELRELVDEETGEKVVGQVFEKEEIYSGPYLNEAPDIVFIPRQFEIAAFGEYEFASDQILDYSQGVSGSHRMEGLLMMRGEEIKAGNEIEGAQIVDLAPSVLYLLGFPIPKDIDGKVLEAAFKEQYLETKEIHFIEEGPLSFFSQEVYSEEEEEELKRQLRGLGYLD